MLHAFCAGSLFYCGRWGLHWPAASCFQGAANRVCCGFCAQATSILCQDAGLLGKKAHFHVFSSFSPDPLPMFECDHVTLTFGAGIDTFCKHVCQQLENITLIRRGMTYSQICAAQRTNWMNRSKLVYELCVCAEFYLTRIPATAVLGCCLPAWSGCTRWSCLRPNDAVHVAHTLPHLTTCCHVLLHIFAEG